MISVENALEVILSQVQELGTERVDISSSLGRIIAEDIYARRDNPPWDNSAMDGYALKAADLKGANRDKPVNLKVIEELPAGYTAKHEIRDGMAIRIMTGAPLPTGADAVVMVEDTEQDGDFVRVFTGVEQGENVRNAGEDIRAGDLVIRKGTLIRPAEVGIMATCSRAFIYVTQRPRVAVLSTGDELADVDEELTGAKIVTSNSYTLSSMVSECGGLPIQLGIARDTREDLRRKLLEGLHADVIVTSGGVSVGDFDYVKDVLSELGSEMKFWKVSMKPGKPLAFGTIGGKPAFGLPGNPVSSMICFEQFVRPALLKMGGHRKPFRPVIKAVLQEDIRKKPGRKHFVRSFVSRKDDGYMVTTIKEQSSGALRTMHGANGLVIFPDEMSIMKKGEIVNVQLIDNTLNFAESIAY